MRWIFALVLVACGAPSKPTNPATLGVEDTALWFMRAALAGDGARARTLALPWYEFAQLSKAAATVENENEWNATLDDLLEQLGREGEAAEAEVVAAKVIDRMTLDPKQDRKVLRPVEVAIVRYEVRERDGRRHASPMPWMFVKTQQGWKFSPKK